MTLEGERITVRDRELFYYKKLKVARAEQGAMVAKLDRIRAARAKPQPQAQCSPNRKPNGPNGPAPFQTIMLPQSEKSQSKSKVDELIIEVEAREKKIASLNQSLKTETNTEST